MPRKYARELGVGLVAAGVFGLIVGVFSRPLFGFVAAIAAGLALVGGEELRGRNKQPKQVRDTRASVPAVADQVIEDFGFRRPKV